MSTPSALKVAYLVNQYPSVSHTFIRREILALESMGVEVLRYSIRATRSGVVDPVDKEEATRTRVILDVGLIGLIGGLVRCLVTRPLRLLEALRVGIRLGWRSHRGVWVHLIYVLEACVLLRWLTDAGADHLHAHFGTNPAGVGMLCRVLGGPKYSFTVHGPVEFDYAPRLGLNEKVARSSFVVAISEFGRSQLYRWCDHEHWPKIRVVRCGVDDAYMEPGVAPIDSGSRRIVCVGRISEQKGQLLLIEAASRLKWSGADSGVGFELVLVGDGEMRGEVEALIGRFDLQDSVRITGWADQRTVRDEILASRALILPSFAEGLPVVIMEALGLQRPVITTYIAGIPELVEPGVTGWLFPAGSVDRVAQAMREALDAPVERLRDMGRTGAERVRERHNIHREAAKLYELIRSGGRNEESPEPTSRDGSGSAQASASIGTTTTSSSTRSSTSSSTGQE